MSNDIGKDLCTAIDIIASKKVSDLKFDKTIQCTILYCSDVLTGEYKAQYQDSELTVYAADISSVYAEGASVYVVVPMNDFSLRKVISGYTNNENLTNYLSSWYYDVAPTLFNLPASEWNTEDKKIAHLGDLYTDLSTGYLYVFSRVEDPERPGIYIYYWFRIADSAEDLGGIANEINLLRSRMFWGDTVEINGGNIRAGTIDVGALTVGLQNISLTSRFTKNSLDGTIPSDPTVTYGCLHMSSGKIFIPWQGGVDREFPVYAETLVVNPAPNTDYWILAKINVWGDFDIPVSYDSMIAVAGRENIPVDTDTVQYKKVGIWATNEQKYGVLALALGQTYINGDEIVTGTVTADFVRVGNDNVAPEDLFNDYITYMEYSVAGTDIQADPGTLGWHSDYAVGDMYSRMRVGTTALWQGPFRIDFEDIENSIVYRIDTTSPIITKSSPSAGEPGVHSTITVSGKRTQGASTANYGFITFTGNGDLEADVASPSPYTTSIGDSDGHISYVVKLYDTSGVADRVEIDTMDIPVLFSAEGGSSGDSPIIVTGNNDDHDIPCDPSGDNVVLTYSGTDIYVYEGHSALTYDVNLSAAGTWRIGTPIIFPAIANFVVGSVTGHISYATVADHSHGGNTDLSDISHFTITYPITGKAIDNSSFTRSFIQTFDKDYSAAPGLQGLPGIGAYLTNPIHELIENAAGNILNYEDSQTSFKIKLGVTDISSEWTYSFVASEGLGLRQLNFNTFDVTGMTLDSGYADITADHPIYDNITLRFNVNKTHKLSVVNLTADNQVIYYDASANLNTPQSITLIASPQGIPSDTTGYVKFSVGGSEILPIKATTGEDVSGTYPCPNIYSIGNKTAKAEISFTNFGDVIDDDTIPIIVSKEVNDGRDGTDGTPGNRLVLMYDSSREAPEVASTERNPNTGYPNSHWQIDPITDPLADESVWIIQAYIDSNDNLVGGWSAPSILKARKTITYRSIAAFDLLVDGNITTATLLGETYEGSPPVAVWPNGGNAEINDLWIITNYPFAGMGEGENGAYTTFFGPNQPKGGGSATFIKTDSLASNGWVKVNSETFVPGETTISGGLITTNTLHADKIIAGTISADRINVGDRSVTLTGTFYPNRSSATPEFASWTRLYYSTGVLSINGVGSPLTISSALISSPNAYPLTLGRYWLYAIITGSTGIDNVFTPSGASLALSSVNVNDIPAPANDATTKHVKLGSWTVYNPADGVTDRMGVLALKTGQAKINPGEIIAGRINASVEMISPTFKSSLDYYYTAYPIPPSTPGFYLGPSGLQISKDMSNYLKYSYDRGLEIEGGAIYSGKDYFGDATHAGYYLSPDGFHIGNATDTISLKYTAGALTVKGGTITGGTFQTSSVTTDPRLRISSEDVYNSTDAGYSTIKFYAGSVGEIAGYLRAGAGAGWIAYKHQYGVRIVSGKIDNTCDDAELVLSTSVGSGYLKSTVVDHAVTQMNIQGLGTLMFSKSTTNAGVVESWPAIKIWPYSDVTDGVTLKVANGGLQIRTIDADYADRAYTSITASAFTPSSNPKYKTNISQYTNKALDKIKETLVYNYKYNKKENMIGWLTTEMPKETVSEDLESYNLQSMVAIVWKGIQELSEKVELLESKI